MKSFIDWLLEASMTVYDALKVFGLGQPPETIQDLNALYKKLAMTCHPDHGGSTRQMQELNAARDILKRNIGAEGFGRSSSAKTPSNSDMFNFNSRIERHKIICAAMMKFFKGFKKAVYKKYFEDLFGKEFTVNVVVSENKDSIGLAGPSLKMEAFSFNREDVFTLTLTTKMLDAEYDVYKGKGLGGADVTFGYWVDATAFTGGKNQVVARGIRHDKADSAPLTKPESVFPKARMQKIAAGKIRTGAKLKKRDFMSMFVDKWQCDFRGDNTWLFTYTNNPKGVDSSFSITRNVVSRMPVYSITCVFYERDNLSKYGAWWPAKDAPKIACGYLPENEETYRFLESIFAYARKVQDKKKIAAFIKSGSDKIVQSL